MLTFVCADRYLGHADHFLANVCCDTSRDFEVKLVGERIGSSGLVSTTCSACGSLQRRRTSRNLRVPTGMYREILLDLAGDIHVDLARKPRCEPRQVRITHAQRRKPEIINFISPVRVPHVPYWSHQLSRMAACIAGTKFMRSRGWEDRRPEAS